MQRQSFFTQGGKWESVHIDELRPHNVNLPSLNTIRNKTVGQLFQASVQSKQAEKRLPSHVNGELHNLGENLPLCTLVSTFRDFRFISEEIDSDNNNNNCLFRVFHTFVTFRKECFMFITTDRIGSVPGD